jgi:hypothetical protein
MRGRKSRPVGKWLDMPLVSSFSTVNAYGNNRVPSGREIVLWEIVGFVLLLLVIILFDVLRYFSFRFEAALLAINIVCALLLLCLLKYVRVAKSESEHCRTRAYTIEQNSSLLLFTAQLTTTIWWAHGSTCPNFSTLYVVMGQISIVLDLLNLLLWHVHTCVARLLQET